MCLQIRNKILEKTHWETWAARTTASLGQCLIALCEPDKIDDAWQTEIWDLHYPTDHKMAAPFCAQSAGYA